MADDLEDDQWLYGDSDDKPTDTAETPQEEPTKEPLEPEQEESPQSQTQPAINDDGPPGVDEPENDTVQPTLSQESQEEAMEDGEVRQNGDDTDKDDEDDDSDDDDVNVVIGDIKTTAPSSYTSLNIKRGGLMTSVGDKNKQLQQPQQTGKFAVEEFEQIGTINGVPASDFNLDSLEDKPWRKPGADITDYFNYGFNEDTWRAYCERQKRMRVNESGSGLVPMNNLGIARGTLPVMSDNSKYANNFVGMKFKAGPPPYRAMMGNIDVIGGPGAGQRQLVTPMKVDLTPKMNTIQVMTADRREYSRKPNFPDLTVPPPATFENFQPDYGFNPEPDPFYGGYEPTQDSQWGNEPPPGWQPTELKQLTGPPPMGPPPAMAPPVVPHMRSPSRRDSPHRESRDRDRDRERESRSRSEKPRDRERERSHRRERSRSRSRRHRSRSRSPSHRSHKKKKSSRRHEDSD